jgi:hypothetical protein
LVWRVRALGLCLIGPCILGRHLFCCEMDCIFEIKESVEFILFYFNVFFPIFVSSKSLGVVVLTFGIFLIVYFYSFPWDMYSDFPEPFPDCRAYYIHISYFLLFFCDPVSSVQCLPGYRLFDVEMILVILLNMFLL